MEITLPIRKLLKYNTSSWPADMLISQPPVEKVRVYVGIYIDDERSFVSDITVRVTGGAGVTIRNITDALET